MREHRSRMPSWAVENQDHNDLFLAWKSITQALISTGHLADLRRELNSACRTGYEGPACENLAQPYYLIPITQDLSKSESQRPVESCRDTLLTDALPQTAANSAEHYRLASVDDDEDGVTVMSFADESEVDEDIYNAFDVPSDIIDEAADLSQFRHPPQSSEGIFTRERTLLGHNRRHNRLPKGLENTAVRLDSDSIFSRACTATSLSALLPNSEPEQSPDVGPILSIQAEEYNPSAEPSVTRERPANPSIFPPTEQDVCAEAGVQGSLRETEATPSRPTSAPRNTKRSRKTGTLRVSDKLDLTSAEISGVSSRLITKDSVNYFLSNCRLIYESWVPTDVKPRLVCNNSIKDSVIAAFDTIRNLQKETKIGRLILRFAYVHLARVIDSFRESAAKDRIQGHGGRTVGQRDFQRCYRYVLRGQKEDIRRTTSKKKPAFRRLPSR